jgi:DNA helicase II / ATP-dependent DNA helicase PcrA
MVVFNEDFLTKLNPQQHSAVTAPLSNILVLAGAGSGKTLVLVSRVAWLIANCDIQSSEVLAVTFTNKATTEMKHRLTNLLGNKAKDLWVGTFHGICHRILRANAAAANLPAHFSILDSDEQARLIKRVILEQELNIEAWPVKLVQAFINEQKEQGLGPNQVALTNGKQKTLLNLYQAYENVCASSGVIDFADLLLRTYRLLRDNKDILEVYQNKFKAILVDEFQDTNVMQYWWIRLLAQNNTAVMAVGDDDQSIYGWRGANVLHIQKFIAEFHEVKCIILEQNYRSTSTILNAANALITRNHNRMGKELWTQGQSGEKILVFGALNELEEAHFIAQNILKAVRNGLALEDAAVLYRSNAQSRVLEEAFMRVGLKYKIYGGLRYFERAEIKDLVAYLRLLVNFDDDLALERIINVPARGIGNKTLATIKDYARSSGISLWQGLQDLLTQAAFTKRAFESLTEFSNLLCDIKLKTAELNLGDTVALTLARSGLLHYVEKSSYDNIESRVNNLQELINAAREFRTDDNEPTLLDFLSYAVLEGDNLKAATTENAINLMTLHASKGLEFPLVFLSGMEEGLFPSNFYSLQQEDKLEEERRLCYVGITRAMRKLVITYAEVRRKYGVQERHKPSRFLAELPEELLEQVSLRSSFMSSRV